MLSPKVFTNAKRYFKDKTEENITFNENDNLIIKGNNLIALASLLKRYENKVKCIYIDPPYNTGNDSFNYNDSFNHSTWLTFMKNRLELARRLLRDDGVIFVQIDDNEQAYLKVLMDEIFGRENFVRDIIWLKGNAQNDSKDIQKNHEYICVYAKNKELSPIYFIQEKSKEKVFKDENNDKFYYRAAGITTGGAGGNLNARPNLGFSIYFNPSTNDFIAVEDYDKEKAKTSNDISEVYKDNKKLIFSGYVIIRPPKKDNLLGRWSWSFDKFNNEKEKILIEKTKNGYSVYKKEFVNEKLVQKDDSGQFYILRNKENPPKSFIDFVGSSVGTNELKKLFNSKIFTNPKPEKLIQRILEISTQENDIVLDFHLGSGTTAAVAHKMNRRYIGVEQMDYIENVTLKRLKKVLGGENGGISKAVNFKGGGSFVYCELKDDANALIDEILKTNESNIKSLKEKIYQDERILPIISQDELKKHDKEFEKLSLDEKQKALITLINKNKLYVNYSDIDDEDYGVSEAERSFTKSFYGGENE